MQIEPTSAKKITEFYLTGLRTDGRGQTPNFFTFLVEQQDSDQNSTEHEGGQRGELLPLAAHGQVILFTHIDLASTALRAAGIEADFRSLGMENVYLIDVARALYLLEAESADTQKTIPNMLDMFARILTTLGIGVPASFADTLIELGKHTDENEYFGDFIDRKEITRGRAIDAVRWCLGTIFSVAHIVTRP